MQLLAWALQWLACYAVLLALHLEHEAGLVGGRGDPARGQRQRGAAGDALERRRVPGRLPGRARRLRGPAGSGLAYGIILQAVEVVTALGLGVPALLREGLTWGDLRRRAEEAEPEEEELRSVAEASAGESAQ